MNETGEEMLGMWFASDRTRDGLGAGNVDRVLDDSDQPMHDPESNGYAPEETNTDPRAEPAPITERLRAAQAELARVPDEFDGPVAGPLAAEAHSAPVFEGAETTASYAAARLLEIATRNADALVEDAREEADQMVARARAEAVQMVQVSLADAEAREASMSACEEEQRVELDRARSEALRELEERRAELVEGVNQLVEFESELRNHLVSYLSGQLETLHGPNVAIALSTDAESRRAS
jgi:cell division septum initiation protein DivIVA